jgi:ABC-type amino acid transport substrate-binding protein
MKLKKYATLALSAILALTALTGCGNQADSGNTQESGNNAKKTAKVIEIDLTDEEYAFGVDKEQEDLLNQVNDFIAEITEDGTLDEICNNYFGDGTPQAVTSGTLDNSKDQLVVATNAAFEPFEYTQGDSYYGIDMEIAARLADKLGKELVIQNMDFDAVCLSVGQQKCDIAMAGLTIKEDRKEYVNFSNPYYSASQRLIVTSDNTDFDSCTDAASIEEILKGEDSSVKVGVQTGTTGQFYCEGDTEWGFDGFSMETVGYKNGSLAVQDLLNGNIQYVVIDSAPAASITSAINEVQ